jgi:hypothetical protein
MRIRYFEAPRPHVRTEGVVIDGLDCELRSYYSCCGRWASTLRHGERIVAVGGGATLRESRDAALLRAYAALA